MEWIDVQIAEVVDETPIDRRFVLDVPPSARGAFAFRPGQHVLVEAHAPDGTTHKSALSLCSDPGDLDTIEVTVRGRGSFGEAVYTLGAGAPLAVTLPRGRFRLEVESRRRIACLGDGSAAAPYRGFVAELARTSCTTPVTLVVTEDDPDHLLYADAFRRHAEQLAAFRYLPVITGDAPGWDGRRGALDRTLLREALVDAGTVQVYACGSTAFVEAATALAREAGVADERIAREKWG